jgi:anti-sigma regulatory factor (Ser/Thr protein kinase)
MKTLALNILDIVQNSVRAKADEISIEVTESVVADILIITITDNGEGIPGGMLENVTDPYVTSRTKRRLGLGLPLLKQHAELAGGNLKIESELNKGTRVTARFTLSHIDRQPLGDITGVLKILIAANQGINFIYCHVTDNGNFRFSSKETKEYLEVEELSNNSLLEDICKMITENLYEIGVSDLILREKE